MAGLQSIVFIRIDTSYVGRGLICVYVMTIMKLICQHILNIWWVELLWELEPPTLVYQLAGRLLPDTWQHKCMSVGICCICHKICTPILLYIYYLITETFLSGCMWFIYSYSSGLLHWHWGNHMIAPVPVKWPWRIRVRSSGAKPQDKATKYMIYGMNCNNMVSKSNLSDMFRVFTFRWADDSNDHIMLCLSKLHTT